MIPFRKMPRIGRQRWENILFIHFPVEAKEIRPYVPDPLLINEYDGSAWLSLVIFQAKHTGIIKTPNLFSYKDFPQLNLRTYVNFGREKGVFFLSLHADDPLVVRLGRLAGLPFLQGEMNLDNSKGSGGVWTHTRGGKSHSLSYELTSPSFNPDKGSLDYFLTEKYCIWMLKGKRILKLPISHLPWTLSRARVNLLGDSFLPTKLKLGDPVTAHYSYQMTAFIHPYESFGIYKEE